jgi:hypothetical protein
MRKLVTALTATVPIASFSAWKAEAMPITEVVCLPFEELIHSLSALTAF